MTPHKKIVKMMGAPNCEFNRRIIKEADVYTSQRRVVECAPTSGWLVGVRVVSSKWTKHYSPSCYSDEVETFYYASDAAPRMTVALVALWPNKPPIEVPAEFVFAVGTFPNVAGPENPRASDMEEQKKAHRDHPEWYRRDAKGRFVKGGS